MAALGIGAALALVAILGVELSRQKESALRQDAEDALANLQSAQEALTQARQLEAQQRTRAEQAQAAEAVERKRAQTESEKATRNFYLASNRLG